MRNSSVPLRPWISWRFWIEIELHVAAFIDPAHQISVFVAIACTFAAAHRDAEQIPFPNHSGSCKGSHLSIVDDLQWYISKFLGQVPEDGNNLLLVHVRRHVGEDVTPSSPVISIDGARGTSTNGLDFLQLACGLLHRSQNFVPVVLGVDVGYVPLRLGRHNHFVVLHSNSFDIALPQIKRETRSISVLTTLLCGIPTGRQLVRSRHNFDLERLGRCTAHLRHCQNLKLVLATN
mmetsp:Transcript_38079/g.101479  ORF Transcript_38079/g.101479 Transcript_38079/m.101479 type:complete len:234 (-) Transcript_38079:295-996(-)